MVEGRVNQGPTQKQYPPTLALLWALSPHLYDERTPKALCAVVIYTTPNLRTVLEGTHQPHFLDEETETHTEPAQSMTSHVFSPYSNQAH